MNLIRSRAASAARRSWLSLSKCLVAASRRQRNSSASAAVRRGRELINEEVKQLETACGLVSKGRKLSRIAEQKLLDVNGCVRNEPDPGYVDTGRFHHPRAVLLQSLMQQDRHMAR